jgi:ribosomal protein S18 acetylase RimI-like enzyme
LDNEWTFRPARVDDFAAVVSLACQLAAHIAAETPPLTFELFQAHYLRPDATMRLLLAIGQDRVVGMISWTVTHELYSAGRRVYISDLAVDLSARGLGVGAALMKEVVAWATAHDVEKLGWDVWRHNETAKAFYKSVGGHVDEEALPYVLNLAEAQP